MVGNLIILYKFLIGREERRERETLCSGGQCDSDQTLEENTQRACRVSIFKDIQNIAEQDSKQSVIPSLKWGLELGYLGCPLQPQLFCE